METMREAMNKAMQPRMAVKLDNLGRYSRDSKAVMDICNNSLKYKYETIYDRDKGLILIGNVVK